MKRCVDSGLWVPADKSIFDNMDDNDEMEENE
jgi:hypothetical protein